MSNGHREWVRLDCGILTHDKVLALLAHTDGYRAFTAYVFALGWAGAHGTEGHIPRHVLPILHATPAIAAALSHVGLWDPTPTGDGWIIRNWELRQVTNQELEDAKTRARRGGSLGACRRWHEPGCTCTGKPNDQR